MVPIALVPEYLCALDIAVTPRAAAHASPMKLMEYMAAGLPIVAPDLPAILSAIGEGRAGVFPAGDFAATSRGSSLRTGLCARPSAADRAAR